VATPFTRACTPPPQPSTLSQDVTSDYCFRFSAIECPFIQSPLTPMQQRDGFCFLPLTMPACVNPPDRDFSSSAFHPSPRVSSSRENSSDMFLQYCLSPETSPAELSLSVSLKLVNSSVFSAAYLRQPAFNASIPFTLWAIGFFMLRLSFASPSQLMLAFSLVPVSFESFACPSHFTLFQRL